MMKEPVPNIDDRLAARHRPDGTPVMYQSWGKLLFMHWQISVESLRPLIPERLMIDTFNDRAWISITPLTIWDAHPKFIPSLPLISNFHELNVRTYVYLDGVPGVWFFSLDANSKVAVSAARTLFSLPYYTADISLEERKKTITYNLKREDSAARFDAQWKIGDSLPAAQPGSLDFFLIERYCLYTTNDENLYRCRIHHQPWPLQQAQLFGYESTMPEANRLPTPIGQPLLHCGGPVEVEVWPLEKV